MSAETPISILPIEDLNDRRYLKLLEPMDAGHGLEVVDCGDERPITDELYQARSHAFGHEVTPGRIYGAVSGLTVASLVSIAVTEGDANLKQFVGEFSPEGFVDLAATMSDRSRRRLDIDLNQHSADSNEGSPVELGDHKELDTDLGCKFKAVLGAVVTTATQELQVRDARRMVAEAGASLPLDEAMEGIRVLQGLIPPEFGIERGALHHAQTRSRLMTPIAIHTGSHVPPTKTELIVDLAGYRSNANRAADVGLPTYHHTPGLMSGTLQDLLPEVKIDSDLVQAAGILFGSATRAALSGEDPTALAVKVIPVEYANVA